MAGEVVITVVGRITDDPAVRFVSNGSAVASFSVAHNSRKFNKNTNEWEDSEPTFYRCSVWGHTAENIAETLRRGMGVIVTGAYGSRSWEANGEKKTVQEMRVDSIGLDLSLVRVDPAHIVKSTGKGGQASAPAQQQAASPAGGSANDPWASAPATADQPPF